MELKGADSPAIQEGKKYKEFTEERAKKLYEELMLQFLKSGVTEIDADRKAKAIIRKQCSIRGMSFWSWA
ncbi:MAG TPA: hypothetical protein VGQ13_06535 [Nitrososphaera sp.]|jgi:hypothetical protein|nr:hypothetical protein [Nitrososphaera sp.]